MDVESNDINVFMASEASLPIQVHATLLCQVIYNYGYDCVDLLRSMVGVFFQF